MPSLVHRSFFCVLPLLLLGLGACAGSSDAFASRFPDNEQAQLAKLVERIQSTPPQGAPPIAVGVTGEPQQLFAYDLHARKVLWKQPVHAQFSPMLAGNYVVLQEQSGKVVGRSLRDGQERFSIDTDSMTLNGAGGSDEQLALVLTSGAGSYARSRVFLVQNGSVAWNRNLKFQAGVPAVVGTLVLVPWGNLFMSALDTESGSEVARVRITDGVLSHVLADRGNVYMGSQHGVGRLTTVIGRGSLRAGPFYAPPREDLPGRPLFLRDAYHASPVLPPASAQHRIRLDWQPASQGDQSLGVQDGNLYLVFYRFVLALDPINYAVRWIYNHDADIVGAAAQPGGLAFGDEAGGVGFLSARSGQPAWREKNSLGATMLALPSSGAELALNDEPPSPSALRESLLAAAQDLDARLVPVRLLVVRHLARLDDPQATADLLTLCDDARTSPPVRDAACAALAARKVGGDQLLAALQRHAGYLEGTQSPPVGSLARAAAAQNEKRAAPMLVAHLQDADTRSQDLPDLVSSLATLQDHSAAAPLGDFLAMYHADAVDEHVVQALELIPDALVKLSGPVATPVLESVANDELGIATVRERARAALAVLEAQTGAAEASQAAAADATAKTAEAEAAAATATPAPAPEERPNHLTSDHITQALLPIRAKLQDCLKQTKPPVFQARVVLMIEEGEARMISVMPVEAQACVEPLIAGVSFPKTKVIKRERLTHVIKR
jgi:hypothetical protein